MKSICIKTNNQKLLDYLLNELNYIELKPVFISSNKFKYYNNIIIHYRGNENNKFIHEISSILACLVTDELEENFLKNILRQDYFYFSQAERNHIIEICYEIFSDDYNSSFNKKFDFLLNDFETYLTEHKSIVLSGFINFRIKD